MIEHETLLTADIGAAARWKTLWRRWQALAPRTGWVVAIGIIPGGKILESADVLGNFCRHGRLDGAVATIFLGNKQISRIMTADIRNDAGNPRFSKDRVNRLFFRSLRECQLHFPPMVGRGPCFELADFAQDSRMTAQFDGQVTRQTWGNVMTLFVGGSAVLRVPRNAIPHLSKLPASGDLVFKGSTIFEALRRVKVAVRATNERGERKNYHGSRKILSIRSPEHLHVSMRVWENVVEAFETGVSRDCSALLPPVRTVVPAYFKDRSIDDCLAECFNEEELNQLAARVATGQVYRELVEAGYELTMLKENGLSEIANHFHSRPCNWTILSQKLGDKALAIVKEWGAISIQKPYDRGKHTVRQEFFRRLPLVWSWPVLDLTECRQSESVFLTQPVFFENEPVMGTGDWIFDLTPIVSSSRAQVRAPSP